MWPSKISNAVGTRNTAAQLTRETMREELQSFAKDSLREELDNLRKEMGETFQQHLEIFRHEFEAFFQTWAYELARGRQSQRYSLADALADSHGAARAHKSPGPRRSTESNEDEKVGPTTSLGLGGLAVRRHRSSAGAGKRKSVRNEKQQSTHEATDTAQEGPEVTNSHSLTSNWMHRHRRHSQSGSLVDHNQGVERTLSTTSEHRRSQVGMGHTLSQSWMHRHRRVSGTHQEVLGDLHRQGSKDGHGMEEKKASNTIGDIVAAIVKPTQKPRNGWLKHHADSYRQLQLTQETVLKAVCPMSETYENSYALIPAPMSDLEAMRVLRREPSMRTSAHSSSTASQDLDMGLSSAAISSSFSEDPSMRATKTRRGSDEDVYNSNAGGFGDIDDFMLALKKSKNASKAEAVTSGKPSLKRGFTMGGREKRQTIAVQGSVLAGNATSNAELLEAISRRRGSAEGNWEGGTSRPSSSDKGNSLDMSSQLNRTSNPPGGSQMLQVVSEGAEGSEQLSQVWRSDPVRRGSKDCELAALDGENSDSGNQVDSEFGDIPDMPRSDRSDCTDRIAELVNSSTFTYVLTSMILINSLIFGFETDWKAQHWSTQPPVGFLICDYFFCSAFVTEIALRISVHGFSFFFIVPGWRWNVFDFSVVLLQLVHQALIHVAESENIRNIEQFVPVLLMARLFRIFRAASMAHLFSELRMLIISIVDSLKSICWAMVLLVLVTWVSSVYFTQVVTIHKVRHGLGDAEQAHLLEAYYGSLLRSILSLFQCISNGISWHEVMDPLITYCSPYMTIVFVFYIMFTMFVVLNVITGIFVETATQKANEDKKKVLMLKLKEFFHHADSDGSGTMTWEKFKGQLEIPEMKVYLKAIDLDQEEAWDLFQLLDMDDSNEIDIEEFVNGCLRLHGEAKALDLATFMYNYKEWTNMWTEHVEQLETTLSRVEDQMLENALKSEQIMRSLNSRLPQGGQQPDESHVNYAFAPELSERYNAGK